MCYHPHFSRIAGRGVSTHVGSYYKKKWGHNKDIAWMFFGCGTGSSCRCYGQEKKEVQERQVQFLKLTEAL